MGNLCRGERQKKREEKIQFIKQIIQNDHQYQQLPMSDHILTESNSQQTGHSEDRRQMEERLLRRIGEAKDVHQVINKTLSSRLIKKSQVYHRHNNPPRHLSTFKQVPLLYLDRLGLRTEQVNRIFSQFQSYSVSSQTEYLINLYRVASPDSTQQSSWLQTLLQTHKQKALHEQQFQTGLILLSNEALYFLQPSAGTFLVKKRVLYQSIKKVTQIVLQDNTCVISLVSHKLNYTGDVILHDHQHYNFYIWFKTTTHQADSLVNETQHIAQNFFCLDLDIDYLKEVTDFSAHIMELVHSFETKNQAKAAIYQDIRAQFFKVAHHKSAKGEDLAQIFKVQQVLAERKDNALSHVQKFFTTQYLIIDGQHLYVTSYKKEKLKVVSKISIQTLRKLKINEFQNFMGVFVDQDKNYNLQEYFKQYCFYSRHCAQICLLLVTLFSENNKKDTLLKVNQVSTYQSIHKDNLINTEYMDTIHHKFTDSKHHLTKNPTQNLQDLSSFLKDYFIPKDESIDHSFGSINLRIDQETICLAGDKPEKVLVTEQAKYRSQL